MWNKTQTILRKIPGLTQLVRKFRKRTRQKSRRDLLLHSIPKYSIGAEIGVHQGDFSEQILTITKPKKLFLIDLLKFDSKLSTRNFQSLHITFQLLCKYLN